MKGDNYIYTSPRLHHTYVYHGQSPLHSGVSPHAQQYYTQNTLVNTSVNVPNAVQKSQNTADNSTVIDNDDEYFYVSNHYNPHHDTAVSVMSNGGYATTTTARLDFIYQYSDLSIFRYHIITLIFISRYININQWNHNWLINGLTIYRMI